MVTTDEDDIEVREARASVGEEVVQGLLRLGRGIGRVEDVARNDERVDLLVCESLEEPAQERCVLVPAREIVQRVSEVPVRGMEELH